MEHSFKSTCVCVSAACATEDSAGVTCEEFDSRKDIVHSLYSLQVSRETICGASKCPGAGIPKPGRLHWHRIRKEHLYSIKVI